MLFHPQNLTAGANGLTWAGKTWSLVNHFIPFTEAEVGSPERFESDFMVRLLGNLTISAEAQAVWGAGQQIWQAYFAATDPKGIRDTFKLNRPDVGWYQIRMALKARATNPDFPPVDFTPFQTAHNALTEKIRPLIYEYEFLR